MNMRVSKSKLSDQVVRELQTMIRSGRYCVGEKLPVESELAEMFNVSRITIRSAVRELSVLGILDVRQGSGTFVNSLTAESFMRPLLPMLSMDNETLSDVFVVRILIESKAAELAALKAKEVHIDRMRDLLLSMDNCILCEDWEGYGEFDAQFHHAIAEASGNRVLRTLHELLHDMVKNTIYAGAIASKALTISCIYHKKIFEAICANNSSAAMDYMHAHVSGGAEYVQSTQRG